MKYTKQEKETARDRLSFLRPGDIVYTELLSVSRSGMSRSVKPFVIRDNAPQWIGGYVSTLLDSSLDRNGGVKMRGCGTDMGFELVYNLSYWLFYDGFPCTGEIDCPSNDHSNGDRDYTAGKMHKDGGYALRHRWL